MEKFKIIHIYKDFDTHNGLIETFFVIAKYHNRNRFDVGVCVFNYAGGSYGKKFQELGGKLYNLNCDHGMKGYFNTVKRLRPFLKQQKPDIVVTHDRRGNFLGIPLAKSAGVPVIISTETTLKDSATSFIRRARDKLVHPVLLFLVSLSDNFMTNSEAVLSQWMSKPLFGKSTIIYPPFNLEKYNEVIPQGERPIAQSENFPTLGYIGRLSEEKGLQYLINALVIIRSSFPKIKLLVAGTGQSEHAFKSLVYEKKLDSCVSFLGFQDNSFKVLSRIDLLVAPSRSEGFGLIALEAMAMGIPVVASEVGGLKEIITKDVGILVPPKNVNILVKAILSLLRQPEKMRKMGQRGHDRAFEVFAPQKYVQELERLYIKLLQQKGLLS